MLLCVHRRDDERAVKCGSRQFAIVFVASSKSLQSTCCANWKGASCEAPCLFNDPSVERGRVKGAETASEACVLNHKSHGMKWRRQLEVETEWEKSFSLSFPSPLAASRRWSTIQERNRKFLFPLRLTRNIAFGRSSTRRSEANENRQTDQGLCCICPRTFVSFCATRHFSYSFAGTICQLCCWC